MSCKIVPSALPHFWKQIMRNNTNKQTNKKIKTVSPLLPKKLTYKDWDFFFLAALVFRVPEHEDLEKQREKKETQRVFPRFLWHPQTIANKQTQFLYQGIAHGSINIHHVVSRTILPIKTRKKTTKPNPIFFLLLFCLILAYVTIVVYYVTTFSVCPGFCRFFFSVFSRMRRGSDDSLSSNQQFLRCVLWLCGVRHASKNN